MNNKGIGSSLALVILLVVALVVSYLLLAVTQMGSLGVGKKEEAQPIQQAQNAVNAINELQHKRWRL